MEGALHDNIKVQEGDRRIMAAPINNYMTPVMPDEEFVVFLTGMRINRWWKPWKWIRVMYDMPRMCRELQANPEHGMMHFRYHVGFRQMMVVQYWKSFDHIHRWATSKTHTHLPAWRWMNKNVGLNGDVGTWHETYVVKRGCYEALYVNMPPHGLGNVGELVEARGKHRTARGRMGQGEDDWSDLGV